MPVADVTRGEARRIALAAQGFDRPRPSRVDARHLRRTIRQLGLLQVDYVNVLVPAHYQVPFARLGPFPRSRLDDLVYRRREFTEQWAHEASIVPVETWPLLRHRMETHRVRPWGFETFLQNEAAYAAWVLEEVRARGPLTADDLPEPAGGPRRMADRWGWGRAVRRQVLEAHFGFGRLAVSDRLPNFQRRYDIVERVIPSMHLDRRLDRQEAQRGLLRLAARAHGVATVGDLADYYRMPIREARPRIAELVEADELHQVQVEGWPEPSYLAPKTTCPRRIGAAALISPFDPLIWTRERAAKLFDFDYRIEIFVPRERRQWGYYVLPFLLGDRLVARVDLKADRASRRLLVQAAYLERNVNSGDVAERLARELESMAGWLGLDTVTVGRRGGFARVLRAVVRG